MRSLGLHLRFSDQFELVIEKALAYKTDIFQSFFVNQRGRYFPLTKDLIQHYSALRGSFKALYAHSAYTINIADHAVQSHPYLHKEFQRAAHLGFTHLILHPGAIKGTATREHALDTVVRTINKLLIKQKDVSLILENSGHSKRALGGDLHDLVYIRSRLDRPERVSFCIDTAHAHVFGYTLKEDTDSWIELVNELLGDAIALLHLNDTKEPLGSHNDRHCFIGQGQLGLDVLKRCATHPAFLRVPIILELPQVTEIEEQEALRIVREWTHNSCITK